MDGRCRVHRGDVRRGGDELGCWSDRSDSGRVSRCPVWVYRYDGGGGISVLLKGYRRCGKGVSPPIQAIYKSKARPRRYTPDQPARAWRCSYTAHSLAGNDLYRWHVPPFYSIRLLLQKILGIPSFRFRSTDHHTCPYCRSSAAARQRSSADEMTPRST